MSGPRALDGFFEEAADRRPAFVLVGALTGAVADGDDSQHHGVAQMTVLAAALSDGIHALHLLVAVFCHDVGVEVVKQGVFEQFGLAAHFG